MFSLFLSEIILKKRENLPHWLGNRASNVVVEARETWGLCPSPGWADAV